MNVLITGGTGALGRHVVMELRERGHTPRLLSRKHHSGEGWTQGNLASGRGLNQAVAGVDAVIHAASATTRPWRLHATDVRGTRRLLDAARQAGVRHFVYPSIVGMEGVAYPYFKYKMAAEDLVRSGGIEWSILRATQFHTLIDLFLKSFAMIPGLAPIPFGWQFQPVDPGEVAVRLVDVTCAQPAGMLADFGGPEARTFKSLAESWLAARGLRKHLVNAPIPASFSRQWTAGRMLCPDHAEGRTTWESYLESRYGRLKNAGSGAVTAD